MNLKGFTLFILALILSILATYIETNRVFDMGHNKTRLSIIGAETRTFIQYGWFWFLPILLLSINVLYQRWYVRVLLLLAPILFCFVFYRTLLSCTQCDHDWRIYAGYFYRYGYYIYVFMGIMIGTFLTLIINELLIFRKRRKQSIKPHVS